MTRPEFCHVCGAELTWQSERLVTSPCGRFWQLRHGVERVQRGDRVVEVERFGWFVWPEPTALDPVWGSCPNVTGGVG